MQRTTIGMTKTPVVATKKNSMDDLVECLSSQYTVGRCLGEPGAFGSVYSIKDKKTGIKLAVKSLKIPAVDSQHYNTLMNLYRKEIDILGEPATCPLKSFATLIGRIRDVIPSGYCTIGASCPFPNSYLSGYGALRRQRSIRLH
uniref:Protein kinase domain-containing protein n=1 Tax=Spongospora subterranea TaxID=70186 RepID=A0A0H5RBN1_9EUKA|eukprot:CRZ11630.1 hypothetical protein [Spongospora subterranea]